MQQSVTPTSLGENFMDFVHTAKVNRKICSLKQDSNSIFSEWCSMNGSVIDLSNLVFQNTVDLLTADTSNVDTNSWSMSNATYFSLYSNAKLNARSIWRHYNLTRSHFINSVHIFRPWMTVSRFVSKILNSYHSFFSDCRCRHKIRWQRQESKVCLFFV